MRRRGWIVLASVVGAIAAAPFVATAPLPSGSLLGVADRFAPDERATFDGGSSEPRRLFCLGDNACPSAYRGWVLTEPVSSADVQGWLDAAGYDAVVEGDCLSGRCSADGTADGWRFSLGVRTDYVDGPSRISISLR